MDITVFCFLGAIFIILGPFFLGILVLSFTPKSKIKDPWTAKIAYVIDSMFSIGLIVCIMYYGYQL